MLDAELQPRGTDNCKVTAFKVRCGCEGGGKGYLGSEELAMTISTTHDQDIFIDKAVSFDCSSLGGGWAPQNVNAIEGISSTLNCTNQKAVSAQMQVRRLTPTECERLQGFPDGYTNIPWRNNSESPDGPRYKALGNSMAVPVMAWIGKRIEEVNTIERGE